MVPVFDADSNSTMALKIQAVTKCVCVYSVGATLELLYMENKSSWPTFPGRFKKLEKYKYIKMCDVKFTRHKQTFLTPEQATYRPTRDDINKLKKYSNFDKVSVCQEDSKWDVVARSKNSRPVYVYSEKGAHEKELKKLTRMHLMCQKQFWTNLQYRLQNIEGTELWAAVTLMLICKFRTGSSAMIDRFGVSTLKATHFNNDQFSFPGKSGVQNTCIISEKKLLNFLRKQQSENLFPTINSKKINGFLEPLGVNAKDIRTYFANYSFSSKINQGYISQDALKEVADELHHTAETCRKHYLFKFVLDSKQGDSINALVNRNLKQLQNIYGMR